MTHTEKNLPTYLRQYCVEQNYEKYTPTEHATWRYIMRQNRAYFADHAVDIYLDGLKQTGIPIDRIPDIREMDDCLQQFGYGAVGVCGFIPPAIFLEFQARGVMPIATDMRTLDHLQYTPAPDIVHEAAGHAPIVADAAYRNYLRSYGRIANKAIFSSEDVRLYEAIRYLSDIKENPDTKPHEVERAQALLDAAAAAVTYTSESNMVARMGWWTIEYGLVGDIRRPKIYGAGLLSSVGESQGCLSEKVRKIPLTVDCVQQSYDITEPQPQLFVAKSLEELPHILGELENTMAYLRGGRFGLEKAQQAKTVNSVLLDSGLAVGGVLTEFQMEREQPIFLRFAGPSQFGLDEHVAPGQGRERHTHGFSTPLGRWQSFPDQPATTLLDDQLRSIGLERGRQARLLFTHGFSVEGELLNWHRHAGKLVWLTWRNCRVSRSDQIYFEPAWGEFDLAVGEAVTSVYAGPPDREGYGDYSIGMASTTPVRQSPHTARERLEFEIFQELRRLRADRSKVDWERPLAAIADRVRHELPTSWLPALEVVELAAQRLGGSARNDAWLKDLRRDVLEASSSYDKMTQDLIAKGLVLAGVPD